MSSRKGMDSGSPGNIRILEPCARPCAYLFGGVEALQLRMQAMGTSISASLLLTLPYLMTIIVLTIVSIRAGRAYPEGACGTKHSVQTGRPRLTHNLISQLSHRLSRMPLSGNPATSGILEPLGLPLKNMRRRRKEGFALLTVQVVKFSL